jgi:hypothetical protein
MCECVLDYIMHNDDMQVLRDRVYLVRNTRRAHMRSRQDCMYGHDARSMCPRRDDNHLRMYSRDRSRRT